MSAGDPAPPMNGAPSDVPPPLPPSMTKARWRATVIGGLVLGLAAVFLAVTQWPDRPQQAGVATTDTAAATASVAADTTETVPATDDESDPAAILRKIIPAPKEGDVSINAFLNGPWVGELEERPVAPDDRWRALFVWHRTSKDEANIIIHATHADAMQTFENLFGTGENPVPYARASHHFDLMLPGGESMRCVMRPSLVVCGRVAPGDRVLVTLQLKAATTVDQTEALDQMMFKIASIALQENAKTVLGTLKLMRVVRTEDYRP